MGLFVAICTCIISLIIEKEKEKGIVHLTYMNKNKQLGLPIIVWLWILIACH